MNQENNNLSPQEKKEKQKAIIICIAFCVVLIAFAVAMNIIASRQG